MMRFTHALRSCSFILTILILSVLCLFLVHSKRLSLASQIELQPQVTMQLQPAELSNGVPLVAYNTLK